MSRYRPNKDDCVDIVKELPADDPNVVPCDCKQYYCTGYRPAGPQRTYVQMHLDGDCPEKSTYVEAMRKLAAKAASWAWVVCDQTIACPCCGIAWWTVNCDVKDNWHKEGCEFQALLVAIGESTGKRVAVDTYVGDERGSIDREHLARIVAEVTMLRGALAERDRLRAALEPFAHLAGHFDHGLPMVPRSGTIHGWTSKHGSYELTVEMLRNARDALKAGS